MKSTSKFTLAQPLAVLFFLMQKSAETHINSQKVDAFLQTILENKPENYPENLKRLIRQAIINLDYFVESEEYSQYCFPALRALEGHIKYLITEAGGKVGHSFNVFNKNHKTGRYYFDEQLEDYSKKKDIEACYNYYKSVRDTVIHFGDILGSVDSTRMIDSKENADAIIHKCLRLIKEKI